MTREIEVTISGKTGSGKTTVGLLIKEALEKSGFSVKLSDPDYNIQNTDKLYELQKIRTDSLKERATVHVRTVRGR